MALIKCEECGADISDSAEFCPHCGYRGKKPEQQEVVNPQPNPSQNQYGQQYFNPNQQPNQNKYYYNNNKYYYNNQKPDYVPYDDDDDDDDYGYNRRKPNATRVNVFGIVGFVLAIVSLFLALWGIVATVGLVFSILGMVFGNQMKEKKTSLALSGIIVNSYSILYTVGQLLMLI